MGRRLLLRDLKQLLFGRLQPAPQTGPVQRAEKAGMDRGKGNSQADMMVDGEIDNVAIGTEGGFTVFLEPVLAVAIPPCRPDIVVLFFFEFLFIAVLGDNL